MSGLIRHRLLGWFTGCKYGCKDGHPDPECPYVRWVDALMTHEAAQTEETT